MKRYLIFIITIVSTCYLLFPQVTNTNLIRDLVKTKETSIQSIKTNATLSLISFCLIALLGCVAAIIQISKGKKVKMFTATIGAVITFLTIISGVALEGEYKQLHKVFNASVRYRDEIGVYLNNCDLCKNDSERKIYLDKAQKLFDKLSSVLDFDNEYLKQKEESSSQPLGIKQSQGFSSQAPGLLWAGDPPKMKPSWLEKMPLDNQYIYFIGKGMNLELLKANEMAEQEARNAAIDYVGSQRGIIDFNNTLQGNINKIIEVSDTYFEKSPDPTNGMYSCYVLVKIKMDILSFVLRRDPSDQNGYKALKIESDIMNQKSIEQYSRDRLATYEFILDAAHEVLDEKSYGDFGTARTLRKNGDFRGAVSILEPILQKYPNFYFGWYNLALSYDNLNEFTKAGIAYQKAIRLEPTEKFRDASLYNTYGFFLFRQGRADLAIPQLEKCLSLAPGHETAQKTLTAARKALGNH